MHFLNIVFGFGVTGVFCALCGDNQQSSVGGQYCFIALGKERRRTKQVDTIGSAFKQKGKGVEEDRLVFEQGARDPMESLLTYIAKKYTNSAENRDCFKLMLDYQLGLQWRHVCIYSVK